MLASSESRGRAVSGGRHLRRIKLTSDHAAVSKSGAGSAAVSAAAAENTDRSEELLSLSLAVLDDDKAEDVVVIDLKGKSSVADAMVIATGRSNRHVGAIVDHLVRKMKEIGIQGCQVEGVPQCDWVLVDAGDVIVHVFRPEVRAFYNLERIWSPEALGETSGGAAAPETPARNG
ncbi:MAG: ribosome silencing factor [Pseudomonadota bacterium]